MSQVTTGIRSVLSNSAVYNATQRVFGAEAGRRDVATRYLQAAPQDRVLDIGCGTAEILPHLPTSVEYWGFDQSEEYIRTAQKRYGDRGHFVCADVNDYVAQDGLQDIDVVLASGVLHHLDDAGAIALINIAWRVLRRGGRLVTIDPTYTTDQSRASRWVVAKDRGQSVREPGGYAELAATEFDQVDVHVRHDLLRIPFSHCILVCTK